MEEFNHQCPKCSRWYTHTDCDRYTRFDHGTPCKQCEPDSWKVYMGEITYEVDPFVKWVEEVRNGMD